jgi:hypothetical protein
MRFWRVTRSRQNPRAALSDIVQCKQESLQVTAALLEALGVPQQVGLPAEVCVSRLLDVEAFLRGNPRCADMKASGDRGGKSPRRWSESLRTGFRDSAN